MEIGKRDKAQLWMQGDEEERRKKGEEERRKQLISVSESKGESKFAK